MNRKYFSWCSYVVILTLAGGCGGLTDDWVFNPDNEDESNAMRGSAMPAPSMAAPSMAAEGGGDLGFSVGGAKDIQNFRENIENDYLPISSDITYEGLFYDYYFDTGDPGVCDQLFCPSYTQMVSDDPLSGEQERFLQVGLNSGMSAADFQRKQLNLVVVLDISGSMGSSFNDYYYDQAAQTSGASPKSKMDVANESIVAMLDHLNPDDRFGMVLFESEAFLGKPISRVGGTNMAAIKQHILEVTEQGGTNMAAGYKMGAELFDALGARDQEQEESRIIFLTDAMPNLGDTSEQSLLGMVQQQAQQKIYTTFIGIGVDFNTALVEAITKVQGANYYAVHSAEDFSTRMDDEFDFMVTPLVFDLNLRFDSAGFVIDEVYGSPEADQATGLLMKVNTLFPSKVTAGETRGGVVMLKLQQTSGDPAVNLRASYRDRQEQLFINDVPFTFNAAAGVVPHTGIRKAILLSRYARLMKSWVESERAAQATASSIPDADEWERTSMPLSVSPDNQAAIQLFLTHWKCEATALNDSSLDQETILMEKLAAWTN